jgi:glutamate 5-kinase
VTVVVKLGSSLVTDGRGHVRRGLLAARASEIAQIVSAGSHVCVVSSGAIALGLPRLGLSRRPKSTPRLQAASALGQVRLQLAWDRALRREGLQAAQILLSARELAERASYVNVRNSLQALLRAGAVPVVNENDATATDEISFGDNDALAAQVAVLIGARLLVLLTEVDGVFTAHPASAGARQVADGSAALEADVGAAGALGRGGMSSKIAAARLAAAAGIPSVIASGRGDDVIRAIVAGERRGTRFAASPGQASAFRLWLRYAKPAAGRLVLDDGARDAVVRDGRSVLAVGVAAVEGEFAPGDAVELVGADGSPLGKGIAGASAAELRARPRGLEAVHRDRLVLYETAGSAAGTADGRGGRVIAPSDADETSAAYFASTPEA